MWKFLETRREQREGTKKVIKKAGPRCQRPFALTWIAHSADNNRYYLTLFRDWYTCNILIRNMPPFHTASSFQASTEEDRSRGKCQTYNNPRYRWWHVYMLYIAKGIHKGIACHLISRATLVYFYGHFRLVIKSFSDVEWNARNLLSRFSLYRCRRINLRHFSLEKSDS